MKGWKDLLLQECVLLYQPLCLQESLLGFIKTMGSYRNSTFYGIKPAIIAIILGAIFPLAKKSLKTVRLGIIGIVLFYCCCLQFNEIAFFFWRWILGFIWNLLTNKDLNSKWNSSVNVASGF
jgi:chromate transporter